MFGLGIRPDKRFAPYRRWGKPEKVNQRRGLGRLATEAGLNVKGITHERLWALSQRDIAAIYLNDYLMATKLMMSKVFWVMRYHNVRTKCPVPASQMRRVVLSAYHRFSQYPSGWSLVGKVVGIAPSLARERFGRLSMVQAEVLALSAGLGESRMADDKFMVLELQRRGVLDRFGHLLTANGLVRIRARAYKRLRNGK